MKAILDERAEMILLQAPARGVQELISHGEQFCASDTGTREVELQAPAGLMAVRVDRGTIGCGSRERARLSQQVAWLDRVAGSKASLSDWGSPHLRFLIDTDQRWL